jgi:hypothetical protein
LVLGEVVWNDEVVFIKSKGTRMTLIARIRAEGFLIQNFLSVIFLCVLCGFSRPINRIRAHPRHPRNPRSMSFAPVVFDDKGHKL